MIDQVHSQIYIDHWFDNNIKLYGFVSFRLHIGMSYKERGTAWKKNYSVNLLRSAFSRTLVFLPEFLLMVCELFYLVISQLPT